MKALHATFAAVLGCVWLGALPLLAQEVRMTGGHGDPLTIVVRDAPIEEVFEMLSKKERVNVLLWSGVEGSVTVSLYDVTVERAIQRIAEAAGFIAERRPGGFTIVTRDDAGRFAADGLTSVRTLEVQYSDAEKLAALLQKHLSPYGDITAFGERRLLVVEDRPDFLDRIERLVREVDREPRQILIEAKILDISLDDSEAFGIDWNKTFEGTEGNFGVRGLTPTGAPGVFFELVNPNIDLKIDALSEEGRVRTLATPTLLAVENEDAEVIIGDRLGFRVTTTINEVTTESVEFLESGVILKFRASVDQRDRILLEVHPEVSTGTLSSGVPNQTTTEVTTRLLVEDGQQVFMGGLIRDRATEDRSGVPILSDVPILGHLFTSLDSTRISTETVVMLTAHLLPETQLEAVEEKTDWLDEVERALETDRDRRREEWKRRGNPLRYDDEAPPAAPIRPGRR